MKNHTYIDDHQSTDTLSVCDMVKLELLNWRTKARISQAI